MLLCGSQAKYLDFPFFYFSSPPNSVTMVAYTGTAQQPALALLVVVFKSCSQSYGSSWADLCSWLS